MKKFTILTFTIFCVTATHTFAQGPSGGGGSSSSSVAYSSGATLTIKSDSTYTGQEYSQTNSDYNVVKDTCATATLTNWPPGVWQTIPVQNFTSNSDINWSKMIE